LIGEAGPEAVMPLTRLPSGNLGVEASSANNNNDNMGNISVEMNISNNGQPVSAKQDGQIKWDAASKKMVIGVILEAAEKNTGNFKSAMKMAVSS
jgi:phage-related minor tail protein